MKAYIYIVLLNRDFSLLLCGSFALSWAARCIMAAVRLLPTSDPRRGVGMRRERSPRSAQGQRNYCTRLWFQGSWGTNLTSPKHQKWKAWNNKPAFTEKTPRGSFFIKLQKGGKKKKKEKRIRKQETNTAQIGELRTRETAYVSVGKSHVHPTSASLAAAAPAQPPCSHPMQWSHGGVSRTWSVHVSLIIVSAT